MTRPTSLGVGRLHAHHRDQLTLGAVAASLEPRHLPLVRDTCRREQDEYPGPCPYVACPYHLKHDIDIDSGALIDNHPGVELEDMVDSCALTFADRGVHTLAEVGRALGVTEQRAVQIEDEALDNLILKLGLPEGTGKEEMRGVLLVVSQVLCARDRDETSNEE